MGNLNTNRYFSITNLRQHNSKHASRLPDYLHNTLNIQLTFKMLDNFLYLYLFGVRKYFDCNF